MSDNDRSSLSRFSLGETPVIDEEAANRVLEKTELALVAEMPVEAFQYFLNEVAQFGIAHWLVPKITRARIDKLRAHFEKFEEQSIALRKQGVLVPMFPRHWLIQTEQYFDDFTMSGKQSHGLTYLTFCVRTIGLFHAAFGVWPTSTTAESDVHADGPLARFACQTLQELVSFKNRVTVDQELGDKKRLAATNLPTASALRKQLENGLRNEPDQDTRFARATADALQPGEKEWQVYARFFIARAKFGWI